MPSSRHEASCIVVSASQCSHRALPPRSTFPEPRSYCGPRPQSGPTAPCYSRYPPHDCPPVDRRAAVAAEAFWGIRAASGRTRKRLVDRNGASLFGHRRPSVARRGANSARALCRRRESSAPPTAGFITLPIISAALRWGGLAPRAGALCCWRRTDLCVGLFWSAR
jgi:hypothetical protein